ncbi:MAG: hypothetical protein GXY06_04755 [Clostridiaceae bacterium]|nr:hypothetical protein [Clostridiaceae bacterium]
MKKRIVALLSVILILSFSVSMVSAETGYFSSQKRVRGAGSTYVICNVNPSKSTDGGSYYVTLTSFSYQIQGVPLVFNNVVGANDLVFRPYTTAGNEATSYPLNFKYASTDSNGEIRKNMSYGNNAQKNHRYQLKCSLGASSATSEFVFSGRWTP